MPAIKTLPLPDFYNESQAYDETYYPSAMQLMADALDWRKRHGIKPSAGDKKVVTVLDIDSQNDFTWLSGSLPVLGRSGKGSMDAQRNKTKWGYKYLNIISAWRNTMDFHPFFQTSSVTGIVRRDDGSAPPANVPISLDQYLKEYQPSFGLANAIGADLGWLDKQTAFYIGELEKQGKNPFTPWSLHCLAGDRGSQLTGIVQALRLFHAAVRNAPNLIEVKGTSPLVEHYSIFSPEVLMLFDSRPVPYVQKNIRLIETLLRSNVVPITGLASSHCVASSVKHLLDEITKIDIKLAKKVYILRDCTAPVVVPGVIDYTDQAEASLAEFQNAGMHVEDSTTPMEDWADIDL